MQVWERIMLLARSYCKLKVSFLGFHNTSLTYRCLQFFNSHREINNYDLPKPEMLLVNGPRSLSLLVKSGWKASTIQVVESLRHGHIATTLRTHKKPFKKHNEILVAPGQSTEESCVLLKSVLNAYDELKSIQILFRPHPAQKISSLSAYLSTDINLLPISIVSDSPIEELLSRAKVVISGSSSVAVDAHAFGCSIFNLHFSSVFITPSVEKRDSQLVIDIFSQSELKKNLHRIFSAYNQEEALKEGEKIINHYLELPLKDNYPHKFVNNLINKKTC